MVYLVVETAFTAYPWCQRLLRGIYEEGRRKRMEIREIEVPEDADGVGTCVLLVGASQTWNYQMARRTHAKGLHPILLANQQYNLAGQPASVVTMNIDSSMELVVDYLHSLGRQRLALYGVNHRSSSDPWRAVRFEELTGRNENIFYQDTTIEDCFQQFLPHVRRFDAVICVSDYVAVSLIQHLQDAGYSVPEDLYIVGNGDMQLSKINKPSLTTISDDYESFGRAALTICSMVERNASIASVNVSLRSRLHIRETTGMQPYRPEGRISTEMPSPENQFFSDPEMSRLARVETMLNQCDDTDLMLIQLLMRDASYVVMADTCFISENTAKYRLKKMKTLCGVGTQKELVQCLKRFF